jgi:hypothetical protein
MRDYSNMRCAAAAAGSIDEEKAAFKMRAEALE